MPSVESNSDARQDLKQAIHTQTRNSILVTQQVDLGSSELGLKIQATSNIDDHRK